MKKINLLIAVFLSFCLAACASVNTYVEPRTGTQPLATVSGSSTRAGVFEWSNFLVSSIDNKEVGMVWSENSKINVIPGRHLFVVNSEFNRGFGSGPYASITEVYVAIKPGMHYRFVGKPSGASMYVWAEDRRGQRVSEIGTSSYQFKSTNTYMPVFVPVK